MSFIEAVKSAFYNYAEFSGRASRSEFWYFFLFLFLCNIVFFLIDMFVLLSIAPVSGPLFSLATLLPYLAVSVRRLHDSGFSGWMILICIFIPLIGQILWLYWMARKGEVGGNFYGADPLSGQSVAVPAPQNKDSKNSEI